MDNEIKPRYVPTDKIGWIRDTHTGAILSVDQRGQKDYRERLQKFKETQAKINSINTLQTEVEELKTLVKMLMDKE